MQNLWLIYCRKTAKIEDILCAKHSQIPVFRDCAQKSTQTPMLQIDTGIFKEHPMSILNY